MKKLVLTVLAAALFGVVSVPATSFAAASSAPALKAQHSSLLTVAKKAKAKKAKKPKKEAPAK